MKKILLALSLFATPAFAATYTAATCSQSDVNAIINGPTHTAVSGDTIVIPAGTCTWTSGITITSVGITITGTGTPNTGAGTVGAGSLSTTLTNHASAPFFSFTGLTYGQTVKVELLTMSASGAASNTIVAAISALGSCTTSGCPNIRVDNINFSAGTWETPLSGGLVTVDNVFGVADHNTASESVTASPPLVQISYDAWQGTGTYGDNSFATSDTSGTAQAMYMENNLLSGVRISENDVPPTGGAVGGARYVCRFNTVTNMSGTGICSAHGTAWGGRFRGQRQVESYYNNVTTGTPGCNAINGLNSGTGYYFSNSVSDAGGGCNKFLAVDIARLVMTGVPWNSCDGTQPWDQPSWSTTTACLDQPGSGVGSLLQGSTPVLASAPGTPCTTSGQCWPHPVLDPVYEAGEVMTAGGLTTPVDISTDGSSLRVLFNRDVYAEVSQSAQSSPTSPFNGTTGTGYGALANRPTTCTTGVGYWATDQGSWNTTNTNKGQLFACTSTNTWTMSYQPYTYPHPLTLAKNLSSITIVPPLTGSGLTGNTGTIQLTAACGYDDGTSDNCTASGITPTWLSLDTTDATVNSSGLVTGTGAAGSYTPLTILAYAPTAWTGAQNGYVYGKRQVRLKYIPTTLTITTGFANNSQITVSSTGELTAYDNVTGNGNSAQSAVAWSSANTSIATVNTLGEVTGISAGAVVISAKVEGLTANFTVNVANPTLDTNTYYTRVGGSDANCTGLGNVDYPGSGSGVACAWGSPDHAAATMGSGATVYVIAGTYSLASTISPPSGTATHPTKFYAGCMLTSNCSSDPYSAGNRTLITTNTTTNTDSISMMAHQYVDMEGFDISTGWECTPLAPSWFPDHCVADRKTRGIYMDQLTAQNTFRYMRIHGFMDGTTGTQGPGNQWIDSALVQNSHTGFNADDPFGANGVIADGNSFVNVTVDASGYVDVLPRAISTLSRASGNLTVTFAGGSIIKYIPGSHIVIQNASPSDLNSTYTVSSVNFNQQSATITGGSISTQPEAGLQFWIASVNTSSTPTFGAGSFVHITGATPSYLNGYWVVSTVGVNNFTFNVSSSSHPDWTSATISSGGTAATSLSLVATAPGSSETATTPGQGTYVRPADLGCDQGTAGYCNGDAWGGGFNTSGIWSFTNTSCQFNLQDCHDNLHGEITSDTIDKFYSNANQGAAIKVGVADSVVVKNAILGATCAANLAVNPDFPGDSSQFIAMDCRAGDAMVVQTRSFGSYIFSNLTWETTQPIGIDDICNDADCANPQPMAGYIMQNLLFEGFLDANIQSYSGSLPSVYFPEHGSIGGLNALWSWNNNMANGMRNPPTGGANNHWTTDPLVVLAVPTITNIAGEINAVTWNMNLTGPSPAIGAGIHNAFTPALDYSGLTRPNPPSIGAFELGGTPTASTPTFSPVAGTYTTSQSVAISTSSSGAIICYTTNGTTPATNGSTGCTTGTLYSSTISVSVSQTIKAIAGGTGYFDSGVGTAVYVISPVAGTPTFSPVAGTYASAQNVTISTVTSGATICYTTDGSTPTANGAGACTHGTTYTTTVSVSTSQTLKAIASKNGNTDSTVGSAAYVITSVAGTPTFNPVAGTYTSTQSVTISSTTTGATLCYTTDGSTPSANGSGTCTHGTTYSTAVSVSSSLTLKAIASKSGNSDSAVGSAAYVIAPIAATPTFSPVAGTYTSTQNITISSTTAGATLCYTTDGTTPTTNGSGTCTHGTTYSGAVSVSISLTIKAIASKSGNTDSSVGSAAYVIIAVTPTFSPVAGTYTSIQSISITTTTSGATICYTSDGSTPTTNGAGTCTHGTTYAGAVSVAVSQTLKAIASKSGVTDSGVGTAAYVINLPAAATPTFSPVAGTYTSTQSVTLSCSTASPTMYYTTDGSTPTTGSTVYSTPISVTISLTLKAICTASGFSTSPVGSAGYVITGTVATPTASPVAGTYSSAQSVTLSDSTSGAAIHYTIDGTTPTSSSPLYSTALAISSTTTLKAIGIKATWADSAILTALYTINPQAATPVWTPSSPHMDIAPFSATIAESTGGAIVCWSAVMTPVINQSSSCPVGSTLYAGAFTIGSTGNYHAVAGGPGLTDSADAVANYTITQPTITIQGVILYGVSVQ